MNRQTEPQSKRVFAMRILQMAGLCGMLALSLGCGSPRGPVVVGKLQSGTFWKNPTSAPSNEGGGFEKGSRVEIYDQFVVVTNSAGDSFVFPQGNYSGLVIKKE